MSERRNFVIVGGGLAGAKAAETLRAEGFDGGVFVVGAEPERPYERPPLSKGYLLGKEPRGSVFVHDAGWYAAHDVELHLGTPVTAIDRADRSVRVGSRVRIPYDRLLLATGARPRRAGVPGEDLDGVLTLRELGDSERIRAVFDGGGPLVVVGAGWIGLEVAAAARSYGVPVTVVEPRPTPLFGVLGPEMGEVFARLHRDHGVELVTGTAVAGIAGGPDGAVRGVRTQDGRSFDAAAVVVGVGVVPRDALAREAGLATGNGVLVDGRLATEDPDVFAAGDVANVMHPLFGTRIRVEHWANALNGGPAAARSMFGGQAPYDRLPYFFSDQYDLGMEYTGWAPPGGYDRVVHRGDPDAREFVAFWLSGGTVVAGMNVNVWDVTDDIRELVRRPGPVDVARLTDPAVPLAEVPAA